MRLPRRSVCALRRCRKSHAVAVAAAVRSTSFFSEAKSEQRQLTNNYSAGRVWYDIGLARRNACAVRVESFDGFSHLSLPRRARDGTPCARGETCTVRDVARAHLLHCRPFRSVPMPFSCFSFPISSVAPHQIPSSAHVFPGCRSAEAREDYSHPHGKLYNMRAVLCVFDIFMIASYFSRRSSDNAQAAQPAGHALRSGG